MKDMLNHLSTNDQLKTTVYFGHSASLQLFLTSLEALKDEINPNADNFLQMSMRKWKTSKIAPFAGNIAVVKYTCPKDDDKVKFFLNEKVLHLDWCTQDGVCNWNDVKQKYAFYTNQNCDHIFCSKEQL